MLDPSCETGAERTGFIWDKGGCERLHLGQLSFLCVFLKRCVVELEFLL